MKWKIKDTGYITPSIHTLPYYFNMKFIASGIKYIGIRYELDKVIGISEEGNEDLIVNNGIWVEEFTEIEITKYPRDYKDYQYILRIWYEPIILSENVNTILAVLLAFSGDEKELDKTDNLRVVNVITGNFTKLINIETPSIYWESMELISDNFNYIYIDNLKRYYFINTINLIDRYHQELNLNEDYLYTYCDKIKDLTAFCVRTADSTKYDDNLIDSEVVSKITIDYEEVAIEKGESGKNIDSAQVLNGEVAHNVVIEYFTGQVTS